MKEYSNYYFAFIDLLGFKEIVKTKTCSEISDIFYEAMKRFSLSETSENKVSIPVIPPEDIQYYIMSDSVCVYIRDDIKSALPVLALLCLNFQVRMLCLDTPVFVRGSISRGDLFADRNILFGPAMVEAYLRAEKLAHVPRIIIPSNLYEETTDQIDKAMLDGFTYLEPDGFYATHYINYFCIHNSTLKYRERVTNHIRSMLNSSLDQSVREKYIYVKSWIDYYNNLENVKKNEQ